VKIFLLTHKENFSTLLPEKASSYQATLLPEKASSYQVKSRSSQEVKSSKSSQVKQTLEKIRRLNVSADRIVFTPDGNQLISAGGRSEIRIWEIPQ
jgi:WD40 repeat protein